MLVGQIKVFIRGKNVDGANKIIVGQINDGGAKRNIGEANKYWMKGVRSHQGGI